METGQAHGMVEAATSQEAGSACDRYLDVHSDYVDGMLDSAAMREHEQHEASCPSCARYARVLDRGLQLVRSQPDVEPSSDFEERLRHRIFHIEDNARLRRDARRPGAGLIAAGLIAAIAWSPLVLRVTRSADAGATQAVASSTRSAAVDAALQSARIGDIAAARIRDQTHPSWYVQPAEPGPDQIPVHRLVSYAGSYSPLIVRPPGVHGPRAVRLVSAIAP